MTPAARALVSPAPPPPPPDARGAGPFTAFPPALAARISYSTGDDLQDDVRMDRATDGTGRARSFWLSPKHSIGAFIDGLTDAEWATLDAFYRAARATNFTVPWGPCSAPVALSVIFLGGIKRRHHGGGLSSASFMLAELP